MTQPVPTLPAKTNPALTTVKKTMPFAPFSTQRGIALSEFIIFGLTNFCNEIRACLNCPDNDIRFDVLFETDLMPLLAEENMLNEEDDDFLFPFFG